MPFETQIRVDVSEHQTGEWWTRNLPKVLLRIGQALSLTYARRAVKRKLLGQVLNRRTGTLIRSVTASPKAELVNQRTVRASFGTNLDYGVAHEVGFEGTVMVRAHERRLRLTRRTKAGKKVRRTKKQRLADAAEGRKTRTTVRAHQRKVNIRARHYLRSTIEDAGKTLPKLISKRAMLIAARMGRLPRVSELMGKD